MSPVFGVPTLCNFQEEAGQNVVKGISTFLDVPTGGGKTLALWYSLFYHMVGESDDDEGDKRIVVVVGPLSALMESQVKELNALGILAAVAFTSNTKDRDQKLEDLNKYRVGLLGPGMADNPRFKAVVLVVHQCARFCVADHDASSLGSLGCSALRRGDPVSVVDLEE
ncbi:hypothetical protein BDZ89DRAFT_1126137 [Hymenopellis radicata]|nr:hypothetical protein BDZ89DRAFT_1126250 [Hymenopellis radicata]KAF9051172.1 hypothetical protein BDZ89DRAFT_1126137 [Hymenopellis radicata]